MQPVAISLFFHLMLLLFSGIYHVKKGAQRLSGRVLDSRLRVQDSPASLRYPSLVLVQPRKTRPCLTEILLMGRKESNQTNKSCQKIMS